MKKWLVIAGLITGTAMVITAIHNTQLPPKTTRKTMKFSDGVAAMGALVRQELIDVFGDDQETINKIERAFADASMKLPGYLIEKFDKDLAEAFMERADEEL